MPSFAYPRNQSALLHLHPQALPVELLSKRIRTAPFPTPNPHPRRPGGCTCSFEAQQLTPLHQFHRVHLSRVYRWRLTVGKALLELSGVFPLRPVDLRGMSAFLERKERLEAYLGFLVCGGGMASEWVKGPSLILTLGPPVRICSTPLEVPPHCRGPDSIPKTGVRLCDTFRQSAAEWQLLYRKKLRVVCAYLLFSRFLGFLVFVLVVLSLGLGLPLRQQSVCLSRVLSGVNPVFVLPKSFVSNRNRVRKMSWT
ncbi:hypothetical protein HOY82DRAFT_639124 [Tuber indicum]|nr:hypothetical protein HOY82DRAFT_639124 [Tuber indicum]